MGRMHAQVYKLLPDVKLVSTFSKYGASAVLVAAVHSARVADSYDDILQDPDVDVVDICLPTDLHAEFTVKALTAGKHVLCEKPMAIDAASADQMLSAATKSGKTLMIAQCIRFWPEYKRLREIVHAGSLGQLRSLQMTRFGAFPTWSSDGWIGLEPRAGGAALDMHIHDTDFVVDLLGRPDEIVSRGCQDERGLSRIFTLMTFGKTIVQLEGGWDLPADAPFRMSLRAVFDRGLVMFDQGPMTIYEDGAEPVIVNDLPVMSAGEQGGNISDLGGYFFELEYFYRCLREGQAVDLATPESSRLSLEIALSEIKQAQSIQTFGAAR